MVAPRYPGGIPDDTLREMKTLTKALEVAPVPRMSSMMSMLSGKRSTESDIYAFNNAKRQRGTATLDLDADML